MNLSTDSKVLHKGTVVATLTPVKDIIENTEETSLSNNRKLHPALDDLYKRSSRNLSSLPLTVKALVKQILSNIR